MVAWLFEANVHMERASLAKCRLPVAECTNETYDNPQYLCVHRLSEGQRRVLLLFPIPLRPAFFVTAMGYYGRERSPYDRSYDRYRGPPPRRDERDIVREPPSRCSLLVRNISRETRYGHSQPSLQYLEANISDFHGC